MNISKKKISIILIIYAVIFNFIGGSLAYLNWETSSDERTEIVFSLTKDFSCAADVGGDISPSNIPLAPTTCTNSEHAIKRELDVKPTIFGEMNIYMDLWLNINSIASELAATSNFKYSLTTNPNSCSDNVITSGNFSGKSVGETIPLLTEKEYTETMTDKYYLYIWLDAAETNINTMNKSFNFSIDGICEHIEFFVISYDLTGGTNGPNNQNKNYGESINISDIIPTKDGYTFVEWNTASDGSGTSYNPGAIYNEDSNLTLYAIWEEI